VKWDELLQEKGMAELKEASEKLDKGMEAEVFDQARGILLH